MTAALPYSSLKIFGYFRLLVDSILAAVAVRLLTKSLHVPRIRYVENASVYRRCIGFSRYTLAKFA